MRRIQRDSSHEEFVKTLTTGEFPIFREIWKLLLFAAALGIKDGDRCKLEKVDSGKAMPETYFSTPGWKGFLYLIGITESGDSDCLKGTTEEQDKLVTAFEEYANRGLYILKSRMQSSTPLDDLISIMLEAVAPETSGPNVEDLI